jgi:transcriptional regulator with XRE-family HTH domain
MYDMGLASENRIKELRLAKGLKQIDVANKIGGVSNSQIAKLERGEGNLTVYWMRKIAEARG